MKYLLLGAGTALITADLYLAARCPHSRCFCQRPGWLSICAGRIRKCRHRGCCIYATRNGLGNGMLQDTVISHCDASTYQLAIPDINASFLFSPSQPGANN